MRREFEEYFAAAERRRDFVPPWYVYPREWEYLIPRHWRSDARYFLTSNIERMIVAPVLAVDGRAGVDSPEFRNALDTDLYQIINRAELVAGQRERSHVSATSVSIALGQIVEKLQTSSLQIWGPETERDRR